MTCFGHEEFAEAFSFVFEHFLPRLIWGMLRMSFKKLELFMTTICGIGISFSIGGAISIKPDRIFRIMGWPSPLSISDV